MNASSLGFPFPCVSPPSLRLFSSPAFPFLALLLASHLGSIYIYRAAAFTRVMNTCNETICFDSALSSSSLTCTRPKASYPPAPHFVLHVRSIECQRYNRIRSRCPVERKIASLCLSANHDSRRVAVINRRIQICESSPSSSDSVSSILKCFQFVNRDITESLRYRYAE
ncbi:hypothetical protein C8R45DRAFT_1033741 [Mycena sanguinolenta]|nr:hypothetical protein C8R45DRAFT_1033741 [Mycena sanguinolenta]